MRLVGELNCRVPLVLAYEFRDGNRPQITNVNDALIEGLLSYSTNACAAFAGVFYWIEETLEIQSLVSVNLPDGFLAADNYYRGTDPLHIANIPPEHARVAFLEQADWCENQDYVAMLKAGGVGDEVELIFSDGGMPVAGLALFRPESSIPFRAERYGWEPMRAYFETTLRSHRQLRSRAAERRLTEQFGLSRRERQVLRLLIGGSTNADICDALGVSLATSKTHLVNIFNKLGVDSRAAAVSFALNLQLQ